MRGERRCDDNGREYDDVRPQSCEGGGGTFMRMFCSAYCLL